MRVDATSDDSHRRPDGHPQQIRISVVQVECAASPGLEVFDADADGHQPEEARQIMGGTQREYEDQRQDSVAGEVEDLVYLNRPGLTTREALHHHEADARNSGDEEEH